MTTYSISVQAAGCLPDSDTYPYTVEGPDEAVEAIMDELDIREGFSPNELARGMDEVASIRDEELRSKIRADLSGGFASFDLGGTYSLTVEEVQG